MEKSKKRASAHKLHQGHRENIHYANERTASLIF